MDQSVTQVNEDKLSTGNEVQNVVEQFNCRYCRDGVVGTPHPP